MKTILFKGWNCRLDFKKYHNGRTCIILTNATPIDEGSYIADPGTEKIAIATVNISGVKIKKNEVIIKDYSKNEGMLDTLIKAEIISNPIRFVKTGYVTCPVCKLLINQDQQ